MHKTFVRILAVQVLILLTCASFAQNAHRSLNSEKWIFRKVTEEKWHPATVPGTVHTDLLANKLIPDPFYADNEKKLQWIENESWEYKTTFSLSKKEMAYSHVELEFEGLDTYARVYLNDSLILSADNMFRQWNTDIKQYARNGKNNLRIVFEPAVIKEKEAAKKTAYTLPGDERVFSRKAPYQYGWDWGPRFVTCGIWKNVRLVFWEDVKIRGIRCIQKTLSDSLAELAFIFEIECCKDGIYDAIVDQPGQQNSGSMYPSTHNSLVKKGRQLVTVDYFIKKPKRWWSNGLGDPNLYHFIVSLSKKNGPVDSMSMDVGLRTIELVEKKDGAGISFYYKLNGIPVFMKGANYIPPDNFLPHVSAANYETLVKQAKDAHMNMLRVWGGGVYADDAFYEACDKNGILVWQDFMFACAMYPGNEKFVSNIQQEVSDNVNRLRNHACLALWCGNNESDEGWKNWGWQKQYKYSATDSAKIWNDYVNLFQDVIPKTLDSIAPGATYVSSSPQIGWGHKESLQQGDSHYWGVWWGMEPFENYNTKVGRFMSEYGFQGMPDLSTFKKFAPEKELSLQSESIKAHQKHPTGYATIQAYMERDYKIPKSFENYVYVSQLLQARGMKTAIETHRRAKPYCMGTLYWQLNDCWPVTSWSSIDYYGTPKASYYQAKRSYQEVIVSVEEKEDSLLVYLVSDKQVKIEGTLYMHLLELNGISSYAQYLPCTLQPNSSTVCLRLSKKILREEDWREAPLLYASFNYDKETVSTIHLLKKPKDLALSKPGIRCRITARGTLEVSTDLFAGSIYLSYPNTVFDDNYFDLLPGDKKVVHFSSASATKDTLIKPVIKSLFDMNE
jgi:beta-mannosidase